MQKRHTDPTAVPVQISMRIPFYIREALVEASRVREVSQTEILVAALKRELSQELRERSYDDAPAPS